MEYSLENLPGAMNDRQMERVKEIHASISTLR